VLYLIAEKIELELIVEKIELELIVEKIEHCFVYSRGMIDHEEHVGKKQGVVLPLMTVLVGFY
jgi:hypothetical protein